MSKKVLLSLFVLFCVLPAVNAASDKIHVSALEEFDTANPSQKIDVGVIEAGNLGSYSLEVGDVIHCDVVKVTSPKRGKRAASFVVCPTAYTTDDNTIRIEENYCGKYASKVISKNEIKQVDPLKAGKKVAVSVGNYFVKGVAPAFNLAEGMIKNEEGNRIKSGVKNVYNNSALSYVEKGQDIKIEPGDSFYFIFKPSNSKNAEGITEEDIEE